MNKLLTKEELLNAYTKLYGNCERASCELSATGINLDELINSSEFLTKIGTNQEALLKSNLKVAFDSYNTVSTP